MKKEYKRAILIGLAAGMLVGSIWNACESIKLRRATGETLPVEEPGEGIGRNLSAYRYLGAPEETEIRTARRLDTYTEGEGPAPAWYRPDEPMSAEWEASGQQIAESVSDNGFASFDNNSASFQQVKDIGCPDWNLCSTLYGWDGHTAEPWEMELYTRITYLEFWGTSTECCEAGADSILRLWDSGYYGETLGELLSARAEDGSLVYSPYAYVWDWEYDVQGLAEIRELCEERFRNGPEWSAPFFRLWYYHDWAVPCYEIDGVFFSTGKGW